MEALQGMVDLMILELENLSFDPVEFAAKLEKTSAGDPNFKDHVATMISCYLKWGTISEAIAKSQGAEEEALRSLQVKYDIKEQDSENVTLENVSAAFPGETCRILQEQSIERQVTSHDLNDFGLEIPFYMRTESFFSLIPCTESDKILRLKLVKVCLVYQYLAHPAKGHATVIEIMIEVLGQLSVKYKSKSLNPSQRLDYMKLLDVKEADTASGISYFEENFEVYIHDLLLNMCFPNLDF